MVWRLWHGIRRLETRCWLLGQGRGSPIASLHPTFSTASAETRLLSDPLRWVVESFLQKYKEGGIGCSSRSCSISVFANSMLICTEGRWASSRTSEVSGFFTYVFGELLDNWLENWGIISKRGQSLKLYPSLSPRHSPSPVKFEDCWAALKLWKLAKLQQLVSQVY